MIPAADAMDLYLTERAAEGAKVVCTEELPPA
jgi:hypothetical protein